MYEFLRISEHMLKSHVRAWVDNDAINYATKYTTKIWKQIFPTVTKSTLMKLYINQNSSISLRTNF